MNTSIYELLFEFSGRIGRGSWWLGFLMGVFAAIGGSLAIDPGVWTAVPQRAPSPALALWNLAWVIPMTAITVKRFNDRARPAWLGYLAGALGVMLIIAEQAGFMLEPMHASAAESLTFWMVSAFMIFALVDNALLKGTPGPNRYGPDPRDPAAAGLGA